MTLRLFVRPVLGPQRLRSRVDEESLKLLRHFRDVFHQYESQPLAILLVVLVGLEFADPDTTCVDDKRI